MIRLAAASCTTSRERAGVPEVQRLGAGAGHGARVVAARASVVILDTVVERVPGESRWARCASKRVTVSRAKRISRTSLRTAHERDARDRALLYRRGDLNERKPLCGLRKHAIADVTRAGPGFTSNWRPSYSSGFLPCRERKVRSTGLRGWPPVPPAAFPLHPLVAKRSPLQPPTSGCRCGDNGFATTRKPGV
jgi:hypothetical protein